MNTVRYPFPPQLDEHEAGFECADALAATQAERMAEHLDRVAVSGTVMTFPKRERLSVGLIVMICGAIVAGCVILLLSTLVGA